MIARCPKRCFKLDIKSQSSWRPHDIVRSTAAWPVIEWCFRFSRFKRDKMKCIGVEGRIQGKCSTVEVRSWHIR